MTRMPSSSRCVAVTAAVLAMLLASCTQPEEDQTPETVAIDVKEDAEATLSVPGLTVRVPIGAVEGTGSLTATRLADAPAAPEGVVTAPAWDIELRGATLRGHLEIEVPVSTAAGHLTAGLSYFDADEDQWIAVEAVVDKKRGVVRAQVDHLSWWAPWTWDTAWLKNQYDELTSPLLGTAGSQPECPAEDELRDGGAKVTSDSGQRVRWCAGVQDGQQVVKVSNGRGYAVEVRHPGWRVVGVEPAIPLLERLTVEAADFYLYGDGATTIAGGQTITLTAPLGASAKITAQPSYLSFTVTAILFGAETLTTTAGFVERAFGIESLTGGEKRAAGILNLAQCISASVDIFQPAEDLSAGTIRNVFNTTTTLVFDCFAERLGDSIQGWALTLTMSLVNWSITAVMTIVDGVLMGADTFTDLDGYQIRITYPTVHKEPRDVVWKSGDTIHTAFRTEDDNVACLLEDSEETRKVTCAITDFSYEVPDWVKDPNLPCGNGISLEHERLPYGANAYGLTSWACIGDVLVDYNATHLRVGEIARMGDVLCTVLTDGVRCEHDPELFFELRRSRVVLEGAE